MDEPKLKAEAESESIANTRVAEIMMGMGQIAYLEVEIKHKESLVESPEEELAQEFNRSCEPLIHYFSNNLVSTTSKVKR